MAWYYILFFATLIFFIVKTILSWIFGEIDIDFDADGDIDFDLSSLLSFKGVMHFLLGFSTYLAATAKFDSTYNGVGVYEFDWAQYLSAVIIGFIFMVVLYRLYKFMMKLNHSNSRNADLDGCDGIILAVMENGDYLVNVYTPSGVIKKQISSPIDFKSGDKVEIYREGNKYHLV